MAASVELDAVDPTGNPYLDTLISGDRYASDSPITYFFDDTDGAGPNGAADDWQPWAKDAFRDVFDTYSQYIPIDFVEVYTAAEANFILRMDSWEQIPGKATATFDYPNASGQAIGQFPYEWNRWTPEHLQQGGYAWHTVLHEVGHGLGLRHSHGSNGLNGQPFPGVDDNADSGDFGLNTGVYTVMSYLDAGEFWAPSGGGSDYGWGFAGTPMAFDIAALQEIYGVRAKAGGNTVYDLPDVNGDGTYWESIHDTGGTDEIRYTGSQDATIDLRAAPLVGENAGGYLSRVTGVAGGYSIANGTWIENAEGGSGNDTLIGNNLDNVLAGNAGHDTLMGGIGNDILLGGDGFDTLDGGLGADAMYGGDLDDVYYVNQWNDQVVEGANAGYDTVYSKVSHAMTANVERLYLTGVIDSDAVGNALDNKIYGNSGDNDIEALGGDDYVSGGGGHDTIDGGTGSDVLLGGGGNDVLDGGSDEQLQLKLADPDGGQETGDTLVTRTSGSQAMAIDPVLTGGDDGGDGGGAGGAYAFGFADELHGGSGDDTLYGRGGDDTLYGNSGQDLLVGGSGGDVLNGGTGADEMRGGSGSDTYVVDHPGDVVVETSGGGGSDKVLSSIDYVLGAYVENLSLTGTADIDGTGNGLANRIIGNGGDNTLSGGGGDDFLSAGNGDDTLLGGPGADELRGGADADVLNGGIGDDTLLGGPGDDTLLGGWGEDWLVGEAGDDILNGGFHSDTLRGGPGDDSLDGGAATDFLIGGSGDDTLTGGSGDDAFIFLGAFGTDTVLDFQDGDQLWISGFGTELDTLGELHQHTSEIGGDTVIDLTDLGGGTIVLEGFTENLQQADVWLIP